jgi:hypothetical protein
MGDGPLGARDRRLETVCARLHSGAYRLEVVDIDQQP